MEKHQKISNLVCTAGHMACADCQAKGGPYAVGKEKIDGEELKALMAKNS